MVQEQNKPLLDSEISVKEKFTSLPKKKKVEFIYDYYKLHILGCLLAILIIGYFAYSVATKQNTYCNITYYGSTINSESFSKIKDTLNESILGNDKKNTIVTDTLLIEPNSVYGEDPSTTQAFAVRLAANEYDILLLEKANFEHFAANNMLLDLSLLDGFDSLNVSNEDLVMSKNQEGTDNLYGIKVDNLNLLKDVGFNNENTYLAIAVNSNRSIEIINILKEFTK